MPRPPPPKLALMISGKPIRLAASRMALGSVSASSVPGTVGTSVSRASRLAAVLSPNVSSCSGVGPTNVMPLAAQARAKAAFSDRKPYPG